MIFNLFKKKISYINRRKQQVYKLLGNKCKKCRIRDQKVLQIDHVNSDGHLERHLSRSQLYSKVILEPKRYQLLCANCNWKKRSQDFKKQKRRKYGFWKRLLTPSFIFDRIWIL